MKRILCFCLIFVIHIYGIQDSWSLEHNDHEFYALKLSKIGVFKGTGDGYELERAPTRLEGLVMFIRLLGKEDDVERTYRGEPSIFKDVSGWGGKYTNYAFHNKISFGIGDGNLVQSLKWVQKTTILFC